MTFMERLQQGIVLFDGAMGTQIQALQPSDEEWDGKQGCSEVLNLTAPEKIQQIHESYFAAGSDVVETNTFGANEIVLADYGLHQRVVEINHIAANIARRAAETYTSTKPRFVAGSIGPGTKLISLGQTDFETMYHSYLLQAQGLIAGGVDLFIIETCQDLLQIKIALIAVQDAQQGQSAIADEIPVFVTVTVETMGSLLVGSDMGAVLAALEPYKIAGLGLNCATGPKQMRPYIKQICQSFAGPVICQPNAGLPQNIDGNMVYTLTIEDFVDELASFVEHDGVRVIGGCCGTTPEYINALSIRAKSMIIANRKPEFQPALASLFSAQLMRQDPAPFFIGERLNANGSKQFKECLLSNDHAGIVAIAQQQQRTGAHGLDVCVAYTGRDEVADMAETVSRITRQVDLPLFIDSTNDAVIEAALQRCGGRGVINSINLEEGEKRVDRLCQLAKRYGAALIALTIDEKGMARDVPRKIAIARRIYDIAVLRHGLRPKDLIFDPLTFTLGSGDESLEDSAIHTLQAISELKTALPGVYTNLGISNVSYGLHPDSREILNSVFLAEAIKAGLDMAIVNVRKIIPLYQIEQADRTVCLNLIYKQGSESPLLDFIHHFKKKAGIPPKIEITEEKRSLAQRIEQCIIQGNSSGLEKLLQECLTTKTALEIINQLLIPAMKKVGALFGAGEMQLPFVLQSAEVMKYAVDKLQPYLEKAEAASSTGIVLATVRGDVHDIGKNLVDIILSNNGYVVYNLGIKCEIGTIIEKAVEKKAAAIGLSGLLVKSTVIMKEYLEEMQRRHLQIPVLLGGAALTRNYVEQTCAPLLAAPVVYCADAFEGLQAMEQIVNGERRGSDEKRRAAISRGDKRSPDNTSEFEAIVYEHDIPEPPFWGRRVVTDIDPDTIFPFINKQALLRGRWGYRRGKLTAEEYHLLIQNQVSPALEQLQQRCKQEKLLVPAVVYGYYRCHRQGDELIIYQPDRDAEWLRFHFPRQQKPPYRCIADFFLPQDSGKTDIIALQVVTIGHKATEEAQRLFHADQYKNYLMLHGLSVEAAEALAEYWHLKIRTELRISNDDLAAMENSVMEKYRGSRYSFGYPACPDLSENRKIFTILQPEQIGVTLTEQDQMVPEQTTSAFIVHHPQAKYFS